MPATWRTHPKLQGRFHPEFPDDLQVIVHDGGPRLAKAAPEVAWVRVTEAERDLFTGTLLNQPVGLRSVSAGSSLRFLMDEGRGHPLMVTEKYLLERPDWDITPCTQCGAAELLDAPSDLMRLVLPGRLGPGAVAGWFSAFCTCGGVQVAARRGNEEDWEVAEEPRR
jgi:hypothetical protein